MCGSYKIIFFNYSIIVRNFVISKKVENGCYRNKLNRGKVGLLAKVDTLSESNCWNVHLTFLRGVNMPSPWGSNSQRTVHLLRLKYIVIPALIQGVIHSFQEHVVIEGNVSGSVHHKQNHINYWWVRGALILKDVGVSKACLYLGHIQNCSCGTSTIVEGHYILLIKLVPLNIGNLTTFVHVYGINNWFYLTEGHAFVLKKLSDVDAVMMASLFSFVCLYGSRNWYISWAGKWRRLLTLDGVYWINLVFGQKGGNITNRDGWHNRIDDWSRLSMFLCSF